jgi:hypothetical protein
MQISDEMVEVARAAYHDARAEASGAGRRHDDSLMRAALEAVMTMMREEVIEECAKVAQRTIFDSILNVPAAIRALKKCA